MTVITTQNKPRRNIVRELSSPNSVRVYKYSPEDIMLQIRRTSDHISIALFPNEARRIAALLIEAADEVQNPSKGVECPHCHWGFAPSVIDQHIREKH